MKSYIFHVNKETLKVEYISTNILGDESTQWSINEADIFYYEHIDIKRVQDKLHTEGVKHALIGNKEEKKQGPDEEPRNKQWWKKYDSYS